jgi:hypothetical protein
MSLVPELSRFFGIIIRMFAETGSPHHSAHFHAYAELHQAELLADWERLQAGQRRRQSNR